MCADHLPGSLSSVKISRMGLQLVPSPQGPVSISDKTSYHKISWSLEAAKLGSLNYRIALKFDRHVRSTVAKVPVKFQSDRTILNTNLAASRLWDLTIRRLVGYWNRASWLPTDLLITIWWRKRCIPSRPLREGPSYRRYEVHWRRGLAPPWGPPGDRRGRCWGRRTGSPSWPKIR